jgi:hypothetical protein
MIAGGNHTQTLRRSAVGLESRVGIASRHMMLGRVMKVQQAKRWTSVLQASMFSYVLKYSNVIKTWSRAL